MLEAGIHAWETFVHAGVRVRVCACMNVRYIDTCVTMLYTYIYSVVLLHLSIL